MQTILAFVIGSLYAAGVYLLLRRSMVKIIMGIMFLSNASNLLIFTMGGLIRGQPPLVQAGNSVPLTPYPDPVPQALILTAIVISFGVLAFLLVLVYKAYHLTRTQDLDSLKITDS